MLTFMFLNFILSETCDPNNELEEGLICCNFSICDKYCYKETCIKSNKIWFCYEEGIGYFFAIKFLPSIILFILRFIIHWLGKVKYLTLLWILCLDFIVNCILFTIINGFFCYEVDVWLSFSILAILCSMPLYFYILYINLTINDLWEFKKLIRINKCFYHLKFLLFKIWVAIFTLTGYFTVFDTFAVIFNKIYRYDWIDKSDSYHEYCFLLKKS